MSINYSQKAPNTGYAALLVSIVIDGALSWQYDCATMKALVLVRNGTLVVEDRPEPSAPQAGWVLVRVAAAGICGSDVPRAYDNGAYHYPLVMGHEFSAVVEDAPPGSAFTPGNRVAVFPLIPNPEETINQIGEYAVGRTYDYFGSRRDGAFQELLLVPEFNLLPVPEGVSLVQAAMTEPCAVAYHAANRPQITAGASAAVIGGGPIGNMVAQWLRIRGCRPVIVSEPDDRKRAIASEMGFSVVDPGDGDPVAAVREITGGGADVTVEACGLPVTFRQAVAAAGLFGQVVFLGNIHGEFTLPESEVSSILRRELTIYGTWNSKVTPRGSDEWTRVLAAMGTQLDLNPLISHRVPIDEGPEVFETIRTRSGWVNKAMIVMRDEDQ
jgi:L-iditol 2-dehydrogenase/galactitol-1-phosphate 5-dehydrogenase